MLAEFRLPTWLRRRDSSKPPLYLKYRSSKAFILSSVVIAVFTDVFLYAVIVPVIPFALTSRIGVEPGKVQKWVSVLVAVYGAALLAFSPICGYFADRSKSRRLPLLLGLFALGGSTVLLNVGSSIGILVLGRLLQGIAAAVVWVVGLALLVDTIGQQDIGQAMGYVGIAMSLGVLVAPLLGGIVFERGGYNAVFAMAYGLIGLDILLRLLLIEKKIAVRWQQDKPTPETSANPDETTSLEPKETSEQSVVPQNQEKQPESSDDSRNITAQDNPPPPKRTRLPPVVTLLKSRRLLANLWGILVQAALLTSFDSVLPLFVRHTFGWNSTGAGLIFLPLVIPSFIGPVIGWLSDTYGPRYLATAGFALAAPFLVLLRLVTHNSLGQKALLCGLLVLIGISIDLTLPPLMAETTYVVEAKERARPGMFGKGGAYAQAYGLFNMAFAGGCLVGPIWAGFVNERAGWGTMAWSLAVLSFVTAIPTLVWCGGYIGKRGRAKVKRRRDAEETPSGQI